MRRLFPLLVAAFAGQLLLAQSHTEAKALLQEASKTMKAYPALEISFTYTFENTRVEPPIKQEQKGTLALQGENYRLKTDLLEQLRVGKKLYNIYHEDEEVQVNTYEESDEAGLSPARILSFYEKGYSYKMGGKESINGRNIQYVILKPTASEEIDKIMIGIDAQTKEVYSMKQWGTNGTVTTLIVTKLVKNAKWPANQFKFVKADYPGYYISE
ncbi:LolA family protein [Croceimicrobium hydrocarbonivorans]|uniref:Outer membrane lipoprotein carrier protein LolA n=1 Tax=Croceimicrobium hydrocarbonivorans TaxID=2761580 RepID=A0A7H0VFA0_9FLAO|nr:outer membrane lipoprotein carrier protein LolA [Croceimicrobium hydrocarbonivorans]QNR24398.1 outer membrane lipoprotein carrier protein LolA [Croceimicrobium hydrocarbonivorans]